MAWCIKVFHGASRPGHERSCSRRPAQVAPPPARCRYFLLLDIAIMWLSSIRVGAGTRRMRNIFDSIRARFDKQQPQDQQQRLTGSCDAGET